MTVVSDTRAWVEAGGDGHRLAALGRAGRVAAFTDGDSRVVAAIHPERPAVGTVGDWVGSSEVLGAAERWLAESGCGAAEGPALLAPWFPHRANLGPYEEPPIAFEPTERGDRWVAAGYAPLSDSVSILSEHDPQIKAAVDRAGALSSRGWRLDSVEAGPSSTVTGPSYERAVQLVHEIASRAYADVPGYLPVDASVVADFYRGVASQIDPRLTLIARDPHGQAAGFVLGAPDGLQPSRKWFSILAVAVVPEHRSTGLATWLVAAAHRAASKAGYKAGVHAMVGVSAGVEDRTWFRGDVIRRYALYHKAW
ncbi:MAG: GNAT family N-acetyltransferase [Myxococcota bacterium]